MANYDTKLQISEDLLRKLALLMNSNPNPKKPIGIASVCRGKSYIQTWHFLRNDKYYQFLLTDYSFFVFDIQSTFTKKSKAQQIHAISMSYYGCPYEIKKYSDYLRENYGEESVEMFKHDTDVRAEYEQTLDDSPKLEVPVTFRYDYSPESYESGRHPASHMHIGFENQIRLGCKRILDPLSFTAFVIRQNYPEIWKKVALTQHKQTFKASIRKSLAEINEKHFLPEDELEMYLE